MDAPTPAQTLGEAGANSFWQAGDVCCRVMLMPVRRLVRPLPWVANGCAMDDLVGPRTDLHRLAHAPLSLPQASDQPQTNTRPAEAMAPKHSESTVEGAPALQGSNTPSEITHGNALPADGTPEPAAEAATGSSNADLQPPAPAAAVVRCLEASAVLSRSGR